jgi:iron-sulfur cluster assembly accessory protein
MVNLTDAAVQKIKDFSTQNSSYQGKFFRVFIQSGGCHGFSYGFTFDQKRDNDEINQISDLEVLIDSESSKYLSGSKIDYIEDLHGAGFVVENPNAKGSCGCGNSVNF